MSITLGRPLAINLKDIDVELPCIEKDYITNSELVSGFDSCLNRTLIFVHVTKYRILCGKIMRVLHNPKREGNNDGAMRRLRDGLATELSEWQLKTRDLDLPEFDLSSTMPQNRSSFQSKEWYEVLYNNATLLLFRPSPMLSDISGDSGTLQKIFRSSKQAIILYAYLHRSRKINYSWITLHSVFMAGLSYLYALSRHFRERRQKPQIGTFLESDPSPIEIVNDTRACSNVLVAVSERWNALRHCHEVFDKLSDAVLADAIRLQCSPHTALQRIPNFLPQADTRSTPSLATGVAAPISDATNSQTFQGSETNNTYGWPTMDYSTTTTNFYSSTSPLAVDSQFRNCFSDLQHLYNVPGATDPVMELSQDWLGYIEGFGALSQSNTQNQGNPEYGY